MAKKLKINKSLIILEILSATIILAIFLIVLNKYFGHYSSEIYENLKIQIRNMQIEKRRQSYTCPTGELTIQVIGGKVCRAEVPNSIYRKIYDTSPFKSLGMEEIYTYFSKGSVEDADMMLNDKIPVDRYDTIQITGKINWTEDPYNDNYWRFIFYSLRPTRNLFYAFDQTNDTKYLEKASQLISGFILDGMNKTQSWDDYHAVSFRTMVLIKTWWKLRENNYLSYDLSEKILKALEVHGEFLADPNHYEKGFNHGLNEASALYLLSVNFPDLPQAEQWKLLAGDRISESLIGIVDLDGILIENSPYYHLYALEKYWEIYKFAENHNLQISSNFDARIRDMVNYATYILQPDNKVPLLGASLDQKINYSGIYKDIAQEFPEFKYVLTKGYQGKKPLKLNTIFDISGETILRSGWGKDQDFINQTQIIFDGGSYRTNHSDLDALSFSLYGGGINLMPDSGLYTYDTGDYKSYFRGTSSHNTVTVDGKNQAKGEAVSGELIQGKGYSEISAEHTLYQGVTHKRTLTLIGQKYVLIEDHLLSDEKHTYQQMFHLFPGANITKEGTTLHVGQVVGSESKNVMNIYQLQPDEIDLSTTIDQKSPINGVCSQEYNKLIPCYSVSYSQNGRDVKYITLIEIGEHDNNLQYSYDKDGVYIQDSTQSVLVKVNDVATNNQKIISSGSNLSSIANTPITPLNVENWVVENNSSGILTNNGKDLVIKLEKDGKSLATSSHVNLDLKDKNLLIKMKVNGRPNVNTLKISFSTNNWKGYVVENLKNAYRTEYDGEWQNISLGKGLERSTGGQWEEHGTGFDWSNIDIIKLTFGADTNTTATLELSKLSYIDGSERGSVIIVFDDGYESILSAVDVLNSYGFKANVAVIADRVENNSSGYLSLLQLKRIKNDYGWNLINHSQHHVDAVQTYYKSQNLKSFEEDLLNGAKFLIENDLNNAPNWYIYPHGATNKDIKQIVGKYYTFARTIINSPESYPFGEPLNVKTISADSSEASNIQTFAPVKNIMRAVDDAKRYKTPLFITFHRIHSTSTDRPGYDIEDFKKIIEYISKQNIPVKTLSEFDKSNGIPEQTMTLSQVQPKVFDVQITYKEFNVFQKFVNSVKYVFDHLRK